MKKLVAGLLVVMLMFTFTGCGMVDKVLEKFETTLNQTTTHEAKELDYDAIIESFVASGLNTFELYIDDSHAPIANVWLKNGKGSVYTSDENVVTVTELGKVTAVGAGTAYVVIGAMDNAMYEVYRYDVFAKAPEANLSNLPEIDGVDFLKEIENFNSTPLNTKELKVGGAHSPTASVWAQSGGECFTSDSSVVTVSSNGTVIAQGRGTAYVVIKSGIGAMFEIYKYIVK